MDDLLNDLIIYALEKNASDIHFVLTNKQLQIAIRRSNQMIPIYQDIWKPKFFEYLKFISKLDLTNPYIPQSGQFNLQLNGHFVYCRFSVIYNEKLQTGVLRILNGSEHIDIDHLSLFDDDTKYFHSLIHSRSGLVISCGPTNSGKTTTLHAFLHDIAIDSKHKVVSLEDPIEIEDHAYLQLEINEACGFTYEKGIEELLRHDPDVICIGETRDSYTAKMVIRAALTGHLVFTTIHAKNTLECIHRLIDLGISLFDLKSVCTCILAQRLYDGKKGRLCIYEILSKEDLRYVLENDRYPQTFKGLVGKIKKGIELGYITDPQAKYDIADLY